MTEISVNSVHATRLSRCLLSIHHRKYTYVYMLSPSSYYQKNNKLFRTKTNEPRRRVYVARGLAARRRG